MHLSSAAVVLALSSLAASYAIPKDANANLVRRKLPYSVVNVDGGSTSSSSTMDPATTTVIEPVVQPPVTVTVTNTPSPTPPTVQPYAYTTPGSSTPASSPACSSYPVSSSVSLPSSSARPLPIYAHGAFRAQFARPEDLSSPSISRTSNTPSQSVQASSYPSIWSSLASLQA